MQGDFRLVQGGARADTYAPDTKRNGREIWCTIHVRGIVSVSCWASPALTKGKEQEVALGQWGREFRIPPLMIPEHLRSKRINANVPVYAYIITYILTSLSFRLFFFPAFSPSFVPFFIGKDTMVHGRIREFASQREYKGFRNAIGILSLLKLVETSG